MTVPGSVATFDLRAQDPASPYGRPMLSLLSGRFPEGAGEVALTPGLASTLGLRIGDVWHAGASSRRVVGLVQNPQSLLDDFALVAPGQVPSPTQVEVLFDGPSSVVNSLGPDFTTSASANQSNALNPETVVLTLATLGMLLIALVSVGGFTVLAQRRLRAIGMVEAMGATRQAHPPRVAGQWHLRRGDRRAGRVRRRPRRLAGLATPPGAERPPPDPCVRAALGRDPARHGAGRGGHVLRRRAPGAGDHAGPGRRRALGPERASQADPPLRRARHRGARGRVLALRRVRGGGERGRRVAAGPRLRGADHRDHPAGAVLPGGAGRGGQQGSRHRSLGAA